MIVTVAGATGFIGRALVKRLRDERHHVRALARVPAKAARLLGLAEDDVWRWDAAAGEPPPEAFLGADAVVNLVGESLADGRWTRARKAALRASRIDATRNLVRALAKLPENRRPAILVSGSAIGYYGDRPDEALDEDAAPGHDFLADLCREWEIAAHGAEPLGMRLVLLRTGLVLGAGGALQKMVLPFKLGVGGRLGSGRQWMSWIHLDDEVGIILHALLNEAVRGPINATAPSPVTNAELTRALGKALHRPAVFPAPGLALKAALGEMAGMLLTRQRVLPAKALATGYRFRFPSLEAALQSALHGDSGGPRADEAAGTPPSTP